MKDYIDDSVIGTIEFKDVTLEQIVGSPNLKKMGSTKIHVYGGEGKNIPHFHLISNNGNEICVCIFDNRYFTHGKYTGTLSSVQRKQLNDWLNEHSIFAPSIDNWEMIRAIWFQSNETPEYISKKFMRIKQPDYSNIVGYKE